MDTSWHPSEFTQNYYRHFDLDGEDYIFVLYINENGKYNSFDVVHNGNHRYNGKMQKIRGDSPGEIMTCISWLFDDAIFRKSQMFIKDFIEGI